jgi:hypothetical protein
VVRPSTAHRVRRTHEGFVALRELVDSRKQLEQCRAANASMDTTSTANAGIACPAVGGSAPCSGAEAADGLRDGIKAFRCRSARLRRRGVSRTLKGLRDDGVRPLSALRVVTPRHRAMTFLYPWTGEGAAEQGRTAPAATWEDVRHWRTAGETARAPPCIWLHHDCIPSRT